MIDLPKKKKRLVCSLSINMTSCMDHTRIPMKKYADRINADYFVLRESDRKPPHLAKYDLLFAALEAGYERVLYLDADIYVRKGVPDIFKYYQNALYDESDRISELGKTRKDFVIQSIQEIDIDYKEGDPYYNTGVIILNSAGIKKLQQETSKINEYTTSNLYYEQHEFNVFLKRAGLPGRSLDRRWNEYSPSGPFNTTTLFNSYFIHVSGITEISQKATRLADIVTYLP